MLERLREHIAKRIQLRPGEFAACEQYFVPRRIRKRQYLLQEGDVCRNLAFVLSGCLREYTVDARGEEHIIQFAIEDWWISDLNSFLTGTVSHRNIDALKDSDVLLLDRAARDRMLEEVPAMERFFRLLLEGNYVASHRRIQDSLSASAEERYLTFLRTYPALAEQLPQHQVASYLGITPQSLSRIRKELAEKS